MEAEMGTDLKAILEQEISALKMENGGVQRGVYEIVSEPFYVPKAYPEILRAFKTVREQCSRARGLVDAYTPRDAYPALGNIIILWVALALPQLLENARKGVHQFFTDDVSAQDADTVSNYVGRAHTSAGHLSQISIYRRPLDLLVN